MIINKILNQKRLSKFQRELLNLIHKFVLIVKATVSFKPPLGVGGLIFLIFLFLPISTFAKNDIAVVDADFDQVDKVLKSYHISYDLIKYSDLENFNFIKKYRVIFFPSGIEKKIESNIVVTPFGKSVGTVEYKKNYKPIDLELVSKNLKKYIELGGYAYFSGYSYGLLDKTFNLFEYYYDFPNLGLEGRIIADHIGDMWNFTSYNFTAMYMTFPGWIVLKSVDNGEILSTAKIKTALGEKSSVISSFFYRGSGGFLYCSYYSTIYSSFKRFNVYRVVGTDLLNRLYKTTNKWEQEVTGSVSDAFHKNEVVRTYRFVLNKGENYLSFVSQSEAFQIDVYDSDMKLILSEDSFDKEQEFLLNSDKKKMIIVKLFPSSKKRWSRFALTMASGSKLFPYKTKFMIFFGIIFISIFGYIAYRFFKRS